MYTDGIYIFDCEVTHKDWLFVFKELDTGERTIIHNNNDEVMAFMDRRPILGGFNNKRYDNYILKAIMCDATPEEIKSINDRIIKDGLNGWEIPSLQGYRLYFDSFDLMDDCQMGTSLKGIEAHLGMSIDETTVSFDIDRAWTPEELDRMIYYCSKDVDATEVLFYLRETYLENKIILGAKRDIPQRQSMGLTNAKLTAKYLNAEQPDKPRNDEREYEYPDKLLREYIPDEVFRFFDKMQDNSISDDELFKGKLNIVVGDCPCTIAYGGIHGAIPTYVEEATETRSIRNKDVASYYPHLLTIPLSDGARFGYSSRNMPSPTTYINTLEERVRAKKSGDKATSNALKLVLNTTYGAMLNQYNGLYDPLMGRSVCISGQLLLLELAEHLLQECPTLKVVQLNTDGIMVSLDNEDEPTYQAITQEWQDRTGFELEEDYIQKIVQKDVNNYIEIPVGDDKPKLKGAALVRGVLTNAKLDFEDMGFPKWNNLAGGAFKINNDAVIITQAIVDYFVKGIAPEETINNATDIMQFQLIAKASSKYSAVYHMVDDEQRPVQKVNRVYATTDTKYGKLYKIHGVTGNHAKMPALPKHCIVDNDNHLSIDDIDKDWYIKQAQSKINDFIGIKPPKQNTRKINGFKKKAIKILENL